LHHGRTAKVSGTSVEDHPRAPVFDDPFPGPSFPPYERVACSTPPYCGTDVPISRPPRRPSPPVPNWWSGSPFQPGLSGLPIASRVAGSRSPAATARHPRSYAHTSAGCRCNQNGVRIAVGPAPRRRCLSVSSLPI
jgi:hypothetical protein